MPEPSPEAAKYHQILDKLKVEVEKLAKKYEQAEKNPPRIVFKGLVKAYMDAVKEGGGVTSVRPATLKAIQTAEKEVTIPNVNAAITALKAHAAQVEKETDKKDKKDVDKFTKEIDTVIKGLQKSLK